ncbi:MAG: exosortase H [Thermoanaerobaculia bacterium]
MKSTSPTEPGPSGRKRLRPEAAFLLKFGLLLVLFFAATAPKPMNDAFVEPFTAGVAKVGGFAAGLFGEETRMEGTVIRSPRFAVNVRTGCNGLETIYIFFAGVLAFPAPWGRKLLGLAGGFLAIQLLNTVRIVSLFYIGVHFPEHFEDSHIVVWQAIVILFGVALFLLWADRYARPNRPAAPEAPR